MEKYFNFKYYLEVGEIIACIVILAFLCLCIVFSKLLDRWEKRQNKRSEEHWKEHEELRKEKKMIFEGESLKDYKLDFKDEKLVRVELPNVEEQKCGKLIELDKYHDKNKELIQQVETMRAQKNIEITGPVNQVYAYIHALSKMYEIAAEGENHGQQSDNHIYKK